MNSNTVIELTKLDRLRDAVHQCFKEEVIDARLSLSRDSTKELVDKGMAMSNLRSVKMEIDSEDGNYLLDIKPTKTDGLFVPAFRRGEPIKCKFSSGLEVMATIKTVHRYGFVISADIREDVSEDDLVGGNLVLSVWPDENTHKTSLQILENVSELCENSEYDLMNKISNMNLSDALTSQKEEEGSHLVLKLMTGLGTSGPVSSEDTTFHPFPTSLELNVEQLDAVKHALEYNLTVIHGPPGTGKSTTIVALVEQLVERGERVIICGPSNVSVDSVLEKLAEKDVLCDGDKVLRIGNRHRMSKSVHEKFSLAAKISHEPDVIQIRENIRQLNEENRISYTAKRSNGMAIKSLVDILRERKQAMTKKFCTECSVLASTLQGLNLDGLDLTDFNTIIIDEVSQCSIPQCFIPAVKAKNAIRLVISGDNKQLPPTVKCRDPSAKDSLGVTLFDLTLAHHGPEVRRLLKIQHRMCSSIMAYSSMKMYDNELVAHDSVANRKLCDNNWVFSHKLTQSPLIWIDTSVLKSKVSRRGFSIGNDKEALVVNNLVRRLSNVGVRSEDIGVISPYKFQLAKLCSALDKEFQDVEVSSIDGFQGREKRVIIISMVMTEGVQNLGFVSDAKRLNVAITRARELLCVVGNSNTLESSNLKDWFLSGFTNHCMRNALIESATNYL